MITAPSNTIRFDIAELFNALSHPQRIAIVYLISEKPKVTVKEIYESLNIAQSAASRHLIIMKAAGIVERSQEGKQTYYRLCTKQKAVTLLAKYIRQCSNIDH